MKEFLMLILLLPLLGFFLSGLGRKTFHKKTISAISCGVIFLSFLLSYFQFLDVVKSGVVVFDYFNFIKVGTFQIPFSLQIDQLSSVFLLIITGVGFLIHVYSASYMKAESTEHYGRFFSYLNLFIFFMLLLVLGGNFVILFMGWEGVGLCSYLLIGYWFKNNEYNYAARKAFIMNRIGDLGFLIAIFWLIAKLDTTSFSIIFSSESLAKLSSFDITAITLLLFVGATGKSAQIPLYTWLPDAMAGPTPVSALIHAATMVTAGIYLVARCNVLYSLAPITQTVIIIIGLSTAILAATIALKQNDIKKILAYSTVSQLGYMFLALGLGAYSAAVFHVLTHAFFKALLFLGSGSVIHAMSGDQDIRNMGGLSKQLKITYATFLIGCFAIAGIPPLSGFFSKDAILLSAFEKSPVLYWLALVGALLTAFYMFRLFFLTFSGKFRGTKLQKENIHESPMAMTIPLIILAVLSIVGGFIGIPEIFIHGGDRLSQFLSPVIGTQNKLSVSHTTEYLLMGLSTIFIIATILLAQKKFTKYQPTSESKLGKLIENKWLVDELYNKIMVNPINQLARVLNDVFEKSGIDAVVNGVGKLVHYSSRQIRLLQNGLVGNYILLMIISMIIIFTFQFFLKK
ncbi:MAG: NADH-quinone oxidoreductase subunit L [Chitinophagaceae bacterium]|nr:MAG: NADH-quinone oxidoreductase subunit L [Chitinophagaceae bacterium]